METLNHILNGFSVCMQPINLWYTFVGVFIGTIIGVLPGIGPSAGIALLIPVTYGMNPTSALIMMCGIYYGTKYGGSTLFFASLLELLDLPESRVITVDICETEEARSLLGSHRLGRYVQERLVASSLEPFVLATIGAAVAATPGPVLVFLDDWHGGEHVLAELQAYAPFVGPEGLLVVADTSFADLAGTPVAPFRSLLTSNPRTAINQFLEASEEFERTQRFLLPGLSNFSDGLLQRRKASGAQRA